jgi:predicted amidohydrolase
MRIGLAQVPHPASFAAGLEAVLKAIAAAADAGARLVCFPECCLKGVRGTDFAVEALTRDEHDFTPGSTRRLFRIDGLLAGVVVCHEGWRYPETVRWAVARGARLVLHPHFCGGPGAPGGPAPAWGTGYYEKAMACRAGENHVWFASVNFALPAQECATSVVSPDGNCVAAGPLHREALVVADLDPEAATGYLARRFAPERYGDESAS